MADYTSKETFTLPSKGKIYNPPINPEVTLRSMTTMEDMERTSPSQLEYKNMSNIIQRCIVDNDEQKISVYDLCLGDYLFLLHKLRVVSFGPSYKIFTQCPKCGHSEVQTISLDDLDVLDDVDSMIELSTFTLPQSKLVITLKLQTPRMLDEIERLRTEYLTKNPDQVDPRLMITLMQLIDTVDGKKYTNRVQLENFVKTLPIRDANYIIKMADKINGKVGIDYSIVCHCGNSQCGNNFLSTFRYSQEFFTPSID